MIEDLSTYPLEIYATPISQACRLHIEKWEQTVILRSRVSSL